MLKPIVTAALILAASAGAASAQPQGDGPPRPRLFVSPSGEPFRGDDGLGAWFAGADADHDGVLTLPEFEADAMRFFKVLDADGNGVVDSFENQAYETRIAPEITGLRMAEPSARPRGGQGFGGRRGGGRGQRPDGDGAPRAGGQPGALGREGAARFGLLNEPQPVRGADADLNQRVTAEEWAKAARRRFDRLGGEASAGLRLPALQDRRATATSTAPRRG